MNDNSKIGVFVDTIMVPVYERIPNMETSRYNPIWSSLHKAKSEGFDGEDDLFTQTVQNAITKGIDMKFSEKSALRCSLQHFFQGIKTASMPHDSQQSVIKMIRKATNPKGDGE